MIKEVVLLVVLCFVSGLSLSVSESNSVSQLPHAADESFSVGYIQMKSAENCSYMVVISTSCSSPKYTDDHISIVFGDAHGNQVYVPRLDDPISKTFEQCGSDTFQVDGECTSDICFAYLRRSGGNDFIGWKPESVKIFTYNTEPVTFDFNTSIPNNTWYGYNFCETPTPPSPPTPTPSPPKPYPPYTPPTPPTPPSPKPSSSYKLSPLPMFVMLLGFVLISIFGM